MGLSSSRARFAARFFFGHLGVSLIFSACLLGLILGVWFPYPYREISGGTHLFLIVIGVDVVCGPALTAVLVSPKKSKRELIADLSLVIVIQLVALGYGLYSVAEARPVVLAFEVDRMVAVTASQIDSKELAEAPLNLQSLSWTGPRLIGVRDPINNTEMMNALDHSLQGVEPSARPGWWQDFSKSIPEAKKRAKNPSELMAARPPRDQAILAEAIRATGKPIEQLYYLPLTSKKTLDWVVLFTSSMNVVGYAPVDGFLN